MEQVKHFHLELSDQVTVKYIKLGIGLRQRFNVTIAMALEQSTAAKVTKLRKVTVSKKLPWTKHKIECNGQYFNHWATCADCGEELDSEVEPAANEPNPWALIRVVTKACSKCHGPAGGITVSLMKQSDNYLKTYREIFDTRGERNEDGKGNFGKGFKGID